jgi:hypothetical protein
MTQSKKTIDMTIYEASDFWDEHDLATAEDVKETKDIKFELRKKKYIGIDEKLFSRIKTRARKLHKTEDVLINEWLDEKVRT